MHQNIQNFSQLTAIDTQRKLAVNLRLKRHGRTVSLVKLNGFIINVDALTFEFDLFDPVKLEIDLLEFDEGTSGIEIELLSVNGYEVLPKYQHHASRSTAYIDKLGKWELSIPSGFYTWYHSITGQGGWIS